jgi:AAA+ superfamily predicted ATPase
LELENGSQMARSDLLVSLIQAGLRSDKMRFRKSVESIIAEERAKKHIVLADRLEDLMSQYQNHTDETRGGNGYHLVEKRVNNLVHEIIPRKKLEQLILPNQVRQICQEVVQEHHRCDLLRTYNLEPRNRLLLIGPPGNGKTSLAEAIAESLMVPLLAVRYEGVVGTYLGETANRLRNLIEHACTRKCVLFFDEFETLGKERGDVHETGEIKRVVSSLLLQIDSLPSHVVVIGATNHSELLDRAVWRRFQIRVVLPRPTRSSLTEWFETFERKNGRSFGYAPSTLAKKLLGLSFSEVEEFSMTVLRQYILGESNANDDMRVFVSRTLDQWTARSENSEGELKGRG